MHQMSPPMTEMNQLKSMSDEEQIQGRPMSRSAIDQFEGAFADVDSEAETYDLKPNADEPLLVADIGISTEQMMTNPALVQPSDLPPKGVNMFWLLVRYMLFMIDCETFSRKTQGPTTSVFINLPQIRLLWLVGLGGATIRICHFETLRQDPILYAIGLTLMLIIFITIILTAVLLNGMGRCCCCKDEQNRSIRQRINEVLGIPHPMPSDPLVKDEYQVDLVFNTDRSMWGTIFVAVCLIAISNRLMILAFWKYDEAAGEREACLLKAYTSPGHHGRCMINGGSIGHLYTCVIAFCYAFASYYRVDPRVIRQMTGYMKSHSDRLGLSDKVQQLRDDIQESLCTEWKASKRLSSRRGEVIGSFVAGFALHFGVYGIAFSDVFLHLDDISIFTLAFGVWIWVSEGAMAAIGLYTIIFEVLKHYVFPSIILSKLAEPLCANTMNDIIGWWMLRQYYVKCVIEIYASRLTSYITVALIAAIVFGVSYFIYPNREGDAAAAVIALMAVTCVASLAFGLVVTTLAVQVYTGQGAHIPMLKREALRMASAGYLDTNDKGETQWDTLKNQDIFDKILADVETNVEPLRVFGLPVTPAFFAALQSLGVSLFFAFGLSGGGDDEEGDGEDAADEE